MNDAPRVTLDAIEAEIAGETYFTAAEGVLGAYKAHGDVYQGTRPHDEIGYHAIRVGDNPGEHTIVFGLLGETMELTVRATNRDCYATGALAAAKFLAGKPIGLYGMDDVLGL